MHHVDKTNFGSIAIEVSGNAHCQVPYHAPINELGSTGSRWQLVTIATLPDGPLLDIFSLYVEEAYEACDLDGAFEIKLLEAWCTLVHVCQRWRNLVFVSPRRLNLRLVCTSGTPVREMLNIWPTLPIVVQAQFLGSRARYCVDVSQNIDGIIAALEHRDRVCQIGLRNLSFDQFSVFATILQESFPALTRLYLTSDIRWFEFPMLHPDSFLGGSAPRLRSLTLEGITFPELPKLLLSSKNLVELFLLNVPHSGYISPEAIVACLSSLTNLEKFSLAFANPRSRLDGPSRRPPSFARVDLHSLVRLELHGVNDDIEDLLSQVNAPLLTHTIVSFFDTPQFDISQFDQFIGRVGNFKGHHQARVKFDGGSWPTQFGLFADPTNGTTLGFSISCPGLDWQLTSLAVLSTSSSSPFRLSSFERLELCKGCAPPGYWDTAMQNTQWLELFRPFTAVRDLYLEDEFAIPLARTLRQFAGNRATEVLPALQNISLIRDTVFFEEDEVSNENLHFETVLQNIRPFTMARQLLGCPVTVQFWN